MVKQRSLRKKKVNLDEEEEEDEEGGLNLAPASVAVARKKKQQAQNIVDIGSKKNINGAKKHKRRSLNVSVPTHAPPVSSQTESNGGGEYTAEKMRELAKLTSKKPVVLVSEFRDGSKVSPGDTAMDEVALMSSAGQVDRTGPPLIDGMEIEIPDATYIQEAKEKRERARAGVRPEDFISLSNAFKEDKGVLKEQGEEQILPQQENNQEVEEWTENQIRKGMGSGLLRQGKPARATGVQQKKTGHPEMVVQAFDPAVLTKTIIDNLESSLQRAKISQKQNENNIQKTEENLNSCQERIQQDEELIQKLSKNFGKAQEMRGYVTAVCAMLAEKSPIIEELQEQLMQCRAERADAELKKINLHHKEEIIPAEKAIDAAMEVLNTNGTLAEAELKASEAVLEAEKCLTRGDHIAVELDEFGRDIHSDMRLSIQKRVARYRSIFLQAERLYESGKHHNEKESATGGITSSESDDEVARYQLRQMDVNKECDSLFDDAEEKFASIKGIKTTLEDWKTDCPEQYECTYMSLSAPALFAPFVRLELLRWDPLDISASVPSNHSWYSILFDYGINARENDPDHQVIPILMTDIVLPHVTEAAERCWNPYSSKQSIALSRTIEDIFIYIDTSSEPIRNLVSLIERRLHEAVDGCLMPSWAPVAVSACRRAQVVLNKNYGRILRLVEGVNSFHKSITPEVYRALIVEKLVHQKVLPYIRSSITEPATVAERILRLLNALQAGDSKTLDIVASELQDILHVAIQSLESATVDGKGQLEPAIGMMLQVFEKFPPTSETQQYRGRLEALNAF